MMPATTSWCSRYGDDGSQALCVFNLSGTSQPEYQIGVSGGGTWRLVLNTDDEQYHGANNPLPETIEAEKIDRDGFPYTTTLHSPAMSAQFYIWEG